MTDNPNAGILSDFQATSNDRGDNDAPTSAESGTWQSIGEIAARLAEAAKKAGEK